MKKSIGKMCRGWRGNDEGGEGIRSGKNWGVDIELWRGLEEERGEWGS